MMKLLTSMHDNSKHPSTYYVLCTTSMYLVLLRLLWTLCPCQNDPIIAFKFGIWNLEFENEELNECLGTEAKGYRRRRRALIVWRLSLSIVSRPSEHWSIRKCGIDCLDSLCFPFWFLLLRNELLASQVEGISMTPLYPFLQSLRSFPNFSPYLRHDNKSCDYYDLFDHYCHFWYCWYLVAKYTSLPGDLLYSSILSI